MVDSLRRKDTDYRTGLPGYACPRCGRSVFPISTETSVTFHCKTGHELPLLDLLSSPSPALKDSLIQFLSDWRRQHQALTKTIEDARKNGYLKMRRSSSGMPKSWRVGSRRWRMPSPNRIPAGSC